MLRTVLEGGHKREEEHKDSLEAMRVQEEEQRGRLAVEQEEEQQERVVVERSQTLLEQSSGGTPFVGQSLYWSSYGRSSHQEMVGSLDGNRWTVEVHREIHTRVGAEALQKEGEGSRGMLVEDIAGILVVVVALRVVPREVDCTDGTQCGEQSSNYRILGQSKPNHQGLG